jgi:hypothetical protein
MKLPAAVDGILLSAPALFRLHEHTAVAHHVVIRAMRITIPGERLIGVEHTIHTTSQNLITNHSKVRTIYVI